MVVPLGPGKFYGSSLPRPRFYSDVKFSLERVDPPTRVMDPLLQWAHEAHWSMGGLSFRRLRLQGRIEGSIKKLRSDQERQDKKKIKMMTSSSPPPPKKKNFVESNSEESETEEEGVVTVGRVGIRTRSQKEEVVTSVEVVGPAVMRKRKLMEEFDKVAEGKVGRVKDCVPEPVVSRTSPRKNKKASLV